MLNSYAIQSGLFPYSTYGESNSSVLLFVSFCGLGYGCLQGKVRNGCIEILLLRVKRIGGGSQGPGFW